MRIVCATLLLGLLVGGCAEQPPPPQPGPWALTRDAIGHFCSMTVADHPGPKAQILVGAEAEAVWFSAVRDAVAYTRLDEERRDMRAFYVSDMGRASWDAPEPDTWIAAETAWFVIGSSKRGGMGAPETIPFAKREQAAAFATEHGGDVVRLAQIPSDYVLGAVTTAQAQSTPPQ